MTKLGNIGDLILDKINLYLSWKNHFWGERVTTLCNMERRRGTSLNYDARDEDSQLYNNSSRRKMKEEEDIITVRRRVEEEGGGGRGGGGIEFGVFEFYMYGSVIFFDCCKYSWHLY